jgi:hypothetical protein
MQRLAVTLGTEGNEDAQKVGQNVIRAMNKPDKRGMRIGIQKTLTPGQLYSPMGLWVGPTYKMTLDGVRLDRILKKITKGMLWEMTKRKIKADRKHGFLEDDVPRLPTNYNVFVHRVGAAPDHEGMRSSEQHILILPRHVIGKGTFIYRYLIADDDPFSSVWGFSFYGIYHFMGYTGFNDGKETHLFCVRNPDEVEQAS